MAQGKGKGSIGSLIAALHTHVVAITQVTWALRKGGVGWTKEEVKEMIQRQCDEKLDEILDRAHILAEERANETHELCHITARDIMYIMRMEYPHLMLDVDIPSDDDDEELDDDEDLSM